MIVFHVFTVLLDIHYLANVASCVSTIELKDNTVIVVLGASGDLAKKKTVNANPSYCSMLEALTAICSFLLYLAWSVEFVLRGPTF